VLSKRRQTRRGWLDSNRSICYSLGAVVTKKRSPNVTRRDGCSSIGSDSSSSSSSSSGSGVVVAVVVVVVV